MRVAEGRPFCNRKLAMKRSYYDLLRVPRNAPPEAIQQAYRALISRAASASPDQAEAVANEVKLARRAFAVLMHPGKRAAYDTYLEEEARREHFVRGPAHYVPDRFKHGTGNLSRKTVWATAIAVLALVAVGAFSHRLAGSQRDTGAQQMAEEAARASKADEVRKANAPARAGSSAPAAGKGEGGR